jgi:ubiquinone biosynthesis protein Coq4
MNAQNDIPYLLRGVAPVGTDSSILVSSSRYLNHARLREWLAMICLRRNGADFPAQAEMYEFVTIINEIRDFDYIEHLFTEERKKNPQLDAWFNAWFISDFKRDDFEHYADGTLGNKVYREIFANNYDLAIYDLPEPKTQLDYFSVRATQTHDLEHLVTGGGIDYMGELVPYWYRITNHFKHLSAELAGELSVMYLFGSLRYTVRTMLHYPQCWPTCQQSIERGMRFGRESGPLFLAKYEDVLHLPMAEARARLGVAGVEDIDTSAVSWQWAEINQAAAAG